MKRLKSTLTLSLTVNTAPTFARRVTVNPVGASGVCDSPTAVCDAELAN